MQQLNLLRVAFSLVLRRIPDLCLQQWLDHSLAMGTKEYVLLFEQPGVQLNLVLGQHFLAGQTCVVQNQDHSVRRGLYSAVHSINVLVEKQEGPLAELTVCLYLFVVNTVRLDQFFEVGLWVDRRLYIYDRHI
jgi:hypothetical protein